MFEELQRAANQCRLEAEQQMKLLDQLKERLRNLISFTPKPSEPDIDKLYEIARDITLKAGYPYTDPRTLETTEPTTTPLEGPLEGPTTMAKTTIIVRANLYYKAGSSDKVYHVWIEKTGSDYYTKFEYGRRGSTLNKGTKVGPTNEPKAYAYYQKIVDEKLAKGYKPLPSSALMDPSLGVPYIEPPRRRGPTGATGPTGVSGPPGIPIGVGKGREVLMGPTTGGTTPPPDTVVTEELLLPMLLNNIDESQLSGFMKNPAWWLQEKHDGRRMILNFQDGGLSCCNKKGKLIEPPQEYWKAIEEYFTGFDFVIDGEACGPIFWVFDLLWLEGTNQMNRSYEDRLENLGMLMRSIRLQSVIQLVGTATTTKGKQAYFDNIKARNGEGVVFKQKDAHYTIGRPNSGGPALKFKFKATATCMVMKVNDKRSVQIAVDDEGSLIAAGNVTIPSDQEIPKPGDLVEVQYLYAYKGGSLYQPVYLGKRDDTEIEQLNKLKFKAE